LKSKTEKKKKKLQKTTFPGVFFSVTRNEWMKKCPWVSEDDIPLMAHLQE